MQYLGLLKMETDADNRLPKRICTNANQQLEQYLLLAKSAKGAALKALITQVLEANGVYVFGELLQLQCIVEAAKDGDIGKYVKLLQIFAYGTYQDYLKQAATLPALSPAMSKKLKCLTIVTLSSKSKFISYNTLLNELDMKNIRELEDLLISAIYADIVQGRLDQQNSRLEVDWTIGRDLTPDDMNYISDTLTTWCNSCETMLQCIKTQVIVANSYLQEDSKKKTQMNEEIANIKSTIKQASGQDLDIISESRAATSHPVPSAGFEVKPKKPKVKGLRGSGMKLWNKN